MNYSADFSYFISNCPTSALLALGEEKFYFLVIPSQRLGEKLEMLVGECSLQVETKLTKKLRVALESYFTKVYF